MSGQRRTTKPLNVNEECDTLMNDKDYWERHARNYDASLRWVLGRPLPRMLELVSEADHCMSSA